MVKLTLRTSTTLLQGWRWSKRTLYFLQAPNIPYDRQKGLSVLLQAFYMFVGGQNPLSVLLQASYTLGGSQIGLYELLRFDDRQASRRLVEV